jgi:hypothetical protein
MPAAIHRNLSAAHYYSAVVQLMMMMTHSDELISVEIERAEAEVWEVEVLLPLTMTMLFYHLIFDYYCSSWKHQINSKITWTMVWNHLLVFSVVGDEVA